MLRRISSTSQTQIGWNSQGAGRARNGTVLDDKRRTRATTTATETARDGQDDTHGSRADYIFSVRRFGFVPMNYIVLRSWWWSDRRSVCDRREERLAVALKWWFTIHWVCTRLGTRKASSSSSWSTLFGVVRSSVHSSRDFLHPLLPERRRRPDYRFSPLQCLAVCVCGLTHSSMYSCVVEQAKGMFCVTEGE